MAGAEGITPDDESYLREVLGRSTAARPAAQSAEEKVAEIQAARGRTSFVRRLLRPASTDEKHWAKGARGERIAAHVLGQLPTGWWSFHDLQVGSRNANVDHVVIGPGGVFTINTKNHGQNVWVAENVFMVGGTRTDHLRKSRWEANRVSRLLTNATGHPVQAQPVIAVLAPRITVKSQPRDVTVVSMKRLTSWLRAQPVRLTPTGVIEIVATSDDPHTWQPHVDRSGTTPHAIAIAPVAEPVGPAPRTSELPSTDGPCVCGGAMVLRRRRSDGNPFYGCSAFPRCRKTRPVQPSGPLGPADRPK